MPADFLRKLLRLATEAEGRLVLPVALRPSLTAWLQGVLTDYEALQEHCRALERHACPRQRLAGLADERVEQVVENGLCILADHELAALALSPVPLRALYATIQARLPEGWLPALAEQGRRLREQDRTVRAAEEKVFEALSASATGSVPVALAALLPPPEGDEDSVLAKARAFWRRLGQWELPSPLRSWMRQLLAPAPHSVRRSPTGYRPALEALEDHVAPATFLAASLLDPTATGSSQQANSNPGSDTITFATPDFSGLTLVFGSLTDNLTISVAGV